MPLHDWTNDGGWDGFYLLWITHLFHFIKPRLPQDFRAYLGSVPTLVTVHGFPIRLPSFYGLR
jgi:hypothetical protein